MEGASANPVVESTGPLKELGREHKLALLIGALGYVPPVYGVQFIQKYDHLPAKAVTFSEMLGFVIPTVLAMLVGKLVDVWGASKVHTLALFLGCVVAPVPLFFWWAHVPQSFAVPAVWI